MLKLVLLAVTAMVTLAGTWAYLRPPQGDLHPISPAALQNMNRIANLQPPD